MTPLSVVVPTRDRARLLDGCLSALRRELDAADELIVADSASREPDVIAGIARRYDARVVRLERPGASAARNAGWREARHDLVGFVDDDVRVHAGWAAAMRWAFDDSVVAFATGGVMVPAHQADAERPVAVTSRSVATALHPGLSGDLGASANLAVRRSVLNEVGGFDETLGPGTWAASAEDLELFDRIFRSGHRGSFVPAARAEHEQWRSRRQLVVLDWRYGKGMGVRLARLARFDPQRARRLAREALVEQGLRPIVRDLRHGYEFGAITVAARTLATVVGLGRGVVTRSVVTPK